MVLKSLKEAQQKEALYPANGVGISANLMAQKKPAAAPAIGRRAGDYAKYFDSSESEGEEEEDSMDENKDLIASESEEVEDSEMVETPSGNKKRDEAPKKTIAKVVAPKTRGQPASRGRGRGGRPPRATSNESD